MKPERLAQIEKKEGIPYYICIKCGYHGEMGPTHYCTRRKKECSYFAGNLNSVPMELIAEIKRLTAERDELLKDSNRMEWVLRYCDGLKWRTSNGDDNRNTASLRDAIDRAMNAIAALQSGAVPPEQPPADFKSTNTCAGYTGRKL